MFAQFSANMNKLLADEEYEMANAEIIDISSVMHLIMHKVEMATLINVHVVDFEKINWERIISYDTESRAASETLLDRVGQVSNVYVLVGGEIPEWQGAEDYFGQTVFSIFWHLNIHNGQISLPKGQPKNIFGLKTTVTNAYKASLLGDSEGITEFRKSATPLQPKHNFPFVTYLIIAVNLAVLLAMYFSGYPNDYRVPLRFGAIHPYWIWNHGQWYRLFTAMFVHFGRAHFITNAFGLVIFGTRVEKYFGRVQFCLIYVLAGLLGSVFSLFISQAYAAGASGAVYGLVGSMFAFTRVTRRSIEFMNWYLMFVFIGVGVAMGGITPGIDNAAHVGGLLGGVVLGWVYARVEGRKGNQ